MPSKDDKGHQLIDTEVSIQLLHLLLGGLLVATNLQADQTSESVQVVTNVNIVAAKFVVIEKRKISVRDGRIVFEGNPTVVRRQLK
jgi:hypothetical protein